MTRWPLAALTLAACGNAAEPSTPDAYEHPFRPTAATPIVSTDGAATAISADADSVVWMTGGDAPGAPLAIHRIDPRTSFLDRALYLGTGHSAAIALSGDSIFWADADAGAIERMPRDGGAPTAIVMGLANVTEVVADFDRVYWVAPDGVHVAGRDGAGAAVLHPEALGAATHVAIDAQRIFWVAADGTWEAPKAGGPRGSLSPATDGYVGVAFAGGYPYEAPSTIAITDAANHTVTELGPDLRGIVSVPVAGPPGPIFDPVPERVVGGRARSDRRHPDEHDLGPERGGRHAPQRVLDAHGRVPAFAVGDGVVWFSSGTIASGTLWASPFDPPTI